MNYSELFFSYSGRINRTTYIFANIGVVVALFCVLMFSMLTRSFPVLNFFAVALMFFATAVTLVAGAFLNIKRLHDLSLSGWYILVPMAINACLYIGSMFFQYEVKLFSDLTCLVVFFLFCVVPGTDGKNDYDEVSFLEKRSNKSYTYSVASLQSTD